MSIVKHISHRPGVPPAVGLRAGEDNSILPQTTKGKSVMQRVYRQLCRLAEVLPACLEKEKEMSSMKMRLSLLGVVVSLAAIVVLSLHVPVTGGQGGAGALILAVDVDSFDGPGVAGSFNVEGTITDGGTGTFQCWGWIKVDESTNVSQVYNIDGRGAIMTQGQEDGLLAVVGGTGDFRNARGEGLQVFNNDFTAFTIAFDLVGAGP